MAIVTRNTESAEWTPAAVRSVLERGTLPEWRKLFADAQGDPKVLEVLDTQVNNPTPLEHPEEHNPYPLAAHLVKVIKAA
jgi:hypothetical protein